MAVVMEVVAIAELGEGGATGLFNGALGVALDPINLLNPPKAEPKGLITPPEAGTAGGLMAGGMSGGELLGIANGNGSGVGAGLGIGGGGGKLPNVTAGGLGAIGAGWFPETANNPLTFDAGAQVFIPVLVTISLGKRNPSMANWRKA